MTIYNEIELLSFVPTDDLLNREQEYYVIGFPQRWREALNAVVSSATDRRQNRIQIKALNSLIQSIYPEVVTAYKRAHHAKSPNWLLATHPLQPREEIFPLVVAWLREFYEDYFEELYDALHLGLEDMDWQTHSIESLRWGTNHSGTALLSRDNVQLPQILAHIVASQLSRTDIVLPHGTNRLHTFHVLAGGNGGHQTELISWPPQWYENHPYSAVLKWKIVTRPWDGRPLALCHYGVRRWHWRSQLAQSERSTLAFQPRGIRRTIDGYSNYFATAKIRSQRYENRQWRFRWDTEAYGDLIESYISDNNFSLDAFWETPTAWMGDILNQANLALFYNHAAAVKSYHYVTPGVTAVDRAYMRDALEDVLEGFRVEESCTRVPYRAPQETHLFSNYPKGKDELAQRQKQIRERVVSNTEQENLQWEIHYQTDETRDGLVEALEFILGLEANARSENVIQYETEELAITLRLIRQTEIFSRLGDQGADARISLIMTSLSSIQGDFPYAVCLVELDNMRGQRGDPKTAIRQGFARTRRLTQFITPKNSSSGKPDLLDDEEFEGDEIEENEEPTNWEESARKSVVDCLRQLGVYGPIPTNARLGEVYLVGSHFLREMGRNGRNYTNLFPVQVVVPPAPGNSPMMVFIPSVDGYLSYPEALLYLANEAPPSISGEEAIVFMKGIFRDELLDVKSIVLVDAVRSRSVWRAIQDGRIEPDVVFLEPSVRASQYLGLTFVRLRRGYEIPQYFARRDKDNISSPQGIFKIHAVPDSRGYYSLQSKPRSQGRKVSFTFRAGDDPGKRSYTPNLLEIIEFAGVEEGVESSIAAVIHKSRLSSATYADATKWPMPIHYADKMEEYYIT